jgi:thiosulfate/3-mercaptopyruvate sulfurtransferase
MTPRYLVSPEWLADHLDDPHVRVIDVSGFLDADRNNLAHERYLAAHLPGAVWFDVASGRGVLSDPDSDLSWTWPPIEQIEAAMGAIGVDNQTTVVITARTSTDPYGHGTMWCTRAWWTLHHSGVDCAILEGGIERWSAQGRPLESGTVTVAPRTFDGTDRRAEAIADRHDVLSALGEPDSCLIDALSPESFRGERVNYSRPGHITGARNLPFRTFIVEPTAVFVPVEEARRIADRAGLFDVERAVLY